MAPVEFSLALESRLFRRASAKTWLWGGSQAQTLADWNGKPTFIGEHERC
jgi:hypothetical protein